MAAASRKTSLIGNIEVPCNECEKIISKKDGPCICCDICNKWYHKGCTDIKTADWKVLTSSQNVLYSCDSCLEKKGDEASSIRDIKVLLQEHLAETRNMMTKMEEKIYKNVDKLIDEKIEKQGQHQIRLETMMKEVKDAEINIGNKIQKEVKIYMDNQREKENKANNIIVLRMEEQAGTTEEEQVDNDRKEIKKLFQKTNPELTAEIENVLDKKKSFRLGKKRTETTKPRPIKIELPDEEMKRQIFRGCRNLRESPFKHVSIQNDLTKEEQEQNFKLRQELRERKEKGEKVCIFNGQIIDEKDRPIRQK